MAPQSQLPQFLRFDVFAVDVRAGELRRNGAKLKLQEQPFQVLCALLEHPGELVTREELRSRLWPADTFVDFDHGLNAAIRRLREALSDSAELPRFVETVARRGYRFMAHVIDTASDANGSSARRVHAATIGSKRWVWIPAAVAAVAISAALIFWLNRLPAVPIVEAVTQLTDDGEPKSSFSRMVTDGVRVY